MENGGAVLETFFPWTLTLDRWNKEGVPEKFTPDYLYPKAEDRSRRYFCDLMTEPVYEYEQFLGFDGVKRMSFRIPFKCFDEKVLEDTGVLYPSYLAYLHQARVVGVASYVAIEIWHKKMKVASSPLPCEYTLEPFRPKKVMDRMQQMLTFEFRKYQCKEQNSELAQQADQEFVGKMADTDMICAIMEGRIKPSWMTEDIANNIPQECVYE